MAEILAAGASGGAMTVVKTVVLLVLLVPWWYLATWVSADAARVRAPQTLWGAVVLGGGAVGLLLCLVIPLYALGLLCYVALAGGAVAAYAFYRDGRVPAEEKVLTKKHLLMILRPPKPEMVEILTKVTIYDFGEKVVMPPDMTTASREEINVYNLVQGLLYDIAWRRCSEADLTPVGDKTRVIYVIDGVASQRDDMTLAQSEAIIQFLKAPADMNVEERRRPQKGKISVDLGGRPIDMELLTTGTTGGQRVRFRIIQEVVRTSLDELSMPEDLKAQVRKLTSQPGLFIASGRRGSGVTSTLYSLLRQYDAYTQHVVAVEAAPALDLENVTQQPYSEDARLPRILAAILQRGADILMVDNCPDGQTAKLIIQAAAAKPVLLGMQATDAFVALAKWVQVCGDAAAAVQHLRGTMCQMLLRKLCEACREAYRPDPDRLAKLNLPASKIDRFYAPPSQPKVSDKGELIVCPNCQGSGYIGRTAAFEVLLVDDDLRQLIVEGATVAQIRAAARKKKMRYLQEQALQKVIEGDTSIQEVVRLTQQAKKS